MSGHSKWATTKHKKAIIDSRRAKVFAKQIRAIAALTAQVNEPKVEAGKAAAVVGALGGLLLPLHQVRHRAA